MYLVPFNNVKVPIGLEDSYMGYGAVVPDGYGVSYNLQVRIFLTKNITFLWRFAVFSVSAIFYKKFAMSDDVKVINTKKCLTM